MITIEDMKAHLNVTFDDDDALIENKIKAAQAWIEGYTGEDYSVLDTVPDDAKEACRQLVALFYENREASQVGSGLAFADTPFGVQSFIMNNRLVAF